MEHEHKVFQYTYSAREQEELQKIRSKYLPREENKLETLHRLDAGVTRKATMHAICVGLAGALLLGLGMSLAMTDLGTVLGAAAFALGIVLGVIGLVLAAIAYPLYLRTLSKERARIAPEVLRLTDELLGEH